MLAYNSDEILQADDLYELQDSFSCSGTPFKYQMTPAELGWLDHVRGKYSIADWIDKNLDSQGLLTFDDSQEMSEALLNDGIPQKAVMLSDETALQRLFFWLSEND